MKKTVRQSSGFTIVELLIVIVVIGILAAITIVAFNGIQQRASNTARVQAANQVIKLLKLYRTETGAYPTASTVCATIDNQCTSYAGTPLTSTNNTLKTNLATFGQLPESVPISGTTYYGITLDLYSPRTIDGDTDRDMLLMYWLDGSNQDCGNAVVRTVAGNDFATSSERNTGSNATRTTCWVGI